MAIRLLNNLLGGINLDLDESRIPANTLQFIKNLTSNANINASAAALSGSDAYAMTPMEGNVALDVKGVPPGDNYAYGFYDSTQTNEGYYALYNSNGDHTIWVIRGNDGTVDKVFQSQLFSFTLNPKYFLAEGRITLELRSVTDPITKQESNFKFLVFTNNFGMQYLLDVEAGIATNSYTTAYFTSSAAFYDQQELISLGVPLPIKCVKLNNPNAYVPVTADGIIDTTSINAPGTGYAVGDTFTISGASPAAGATGEVISIGLGGVVHSIIITNGGTGYLVATGAVTTATTGAGAGLTIDILNLVTPDSSKQNLLINQGWQFRIRTWDAFGRPSDWGIISSVYTSLIGGGCVTTSNGLPRCVNLCFDAGNPLVKFITVAYRKGVGNDPTGQTETEWFEHETFRKYNDSQPVEWYDREINPNFSAAGSGISFDASTNIITYSFCADKESNPVDSVEASITQPGMPLQSSSVGSINKRILLANNSYDFDPISQDIVDNVNFTVKLPSAGAGNVPCPAAKLETIIIYANLYNVYHDFSPLIRNTSGVVTFGDGGNNLGPGDHSCFVNNFKVGQVFADQTNPGFIAYLAGTPYKAIGVWGNYNPTTGVFTKDTGFTGHGFTDIKMTQFTFVDVPAGKYVARLSSHHSTINDANLQQTSTTVAGVCNIGAAQVAWGRRTGYASNPVKEIIVDCSLGPVNLGTVNDPMFVILDLNNGDASTHGSNGSRGNALDGYLYEYENGGPVEMAVVYMHGNANGARGDGYGSFFTDHNGYYFATSGTSYCGVNIYVDLCDGAGTREIFAQTSGCGGSTGKMAHGDGTGTNTPQYWGNYGNYFCRVYVARPGGPVITYPLSANRTIKQKITICGNPNIGVPGIPVVMTKCQPAITDSSGYATITAHNRFTYLATNFEGTHAPPPFLSNYIPDYGVSPGNEDLLIFSQKGGCEWNKCSTCDTSMPDVIVAYLGCCPIPPGLCNRITILTGLSAQPNGVGIYGVQAGGKYPVAFWVHDFLGRHTSPQIKSGDYGYVFVPNLNDTNISPYPAMALSSLQVTIPAGLSVDINFKRITFLVGSNCLFRDYFSWGADWVQYVDNTGATNTSNPSAIRIYFQSLNEYNKQYNFGTNVAWDFITAPDPSQPKDVVQFIMNGDGTFLAPQKGAPITYDRFGSFFTIDYIPELAGLQNGCLFRVVRPTQNTTGANLPYYEQCLTLDITNGVLPAGTYTIPYQDSYLLSRSIPVPLLKNQPGPISPGGTPINLPIEYTSTDSTTVPQGDYSTNNKANNNNAVIFQTVDWPTTYPFFFESPSPSDLWGSHLASKGRVGIPNPYQQKYRVGTEIALSNPLADRGIVNGIGTFLSDNRKAFDRNTYGDITVVLVEQGVCMVICNNDYFITRYNQTQIQINPDGQVMGQNSEGSVFTDPQMKAGSNYGVVMQNINTISKFNGQVVFLDSKGHLIFSDFSNAKPVEKDGYLGYILNKIAYVNIDNNKARGFTYFVGVIDPKTMEYNLTSFKIPDTGSPSYLNTQRQPNVSVNETLVFDLATAVLKSFASYTPEYYGRMPGYYLQRQFLSFKNGIPYIHHNSLVDGGTPPAYCNFYGTQCEVRVTHVINAADGKPLPDKVKRYLWEEVYCRQSIQGVTGTMPTALFFADVINSEKGQTSRLLVARWGIKDGYQTAAFICASNTPPDPNYVPQTTTNAILDGDPLQGKWLQVALTNNPAWAGTYFEITALASYTNGVEKSAD